MRAKQALLKQALDAVRHLGESQPPWEEVLCSASRLMGTDGAVFIANRHGHVNVQQVAADPAAVRDYADHFHSQDVLLAPGMNLPVGSWLDTQIVLSPSGRSHSSYYNDFMCRHHMRQLGAVILSRQTRGWTSLGLQNEHVDPRLSERMKSAHVSRYLRELNMAVEARSRAVEQWLLIAECMFRTLEEAVLLVSPQGAIIQSDDALAARLESHGMLRLGVLWHGSDRVRSLLLAALARANAGHDGALVRVPCSRDSVVELQFVKAAPSLRLLNEDLVFVRARFSQPPSDADAGDLRDIFAITPAEAQVLCALMRGEVAKAYASREGVSIHTVRKQIAMLLQKMDCSRQIELVQKATRALGRQAH